MKGSVVGYHVVCKEISPKNCWPFGQYQIFRQKNGLVFFLSKHDLRGVEGEG